MHKSIYSMALLHIFILGKVLPAAILSHFLHMLDTRGESCSKPQALLGLEGCHGA